MNESSEGEEKTPPPLQQTQQPQPTAAIQNDGWNTRAGSLGDGILGERKPESVDGASEDLSDPARFSAGVVRFYEALLREPIPDKMMRLVEEIAKRERKS